MQSAELAFWLPIIIIFASGLLAAVIKRYTKDSCLKEFDRCFVFLRLKEGRWMAGELIVYSNCLELLYREGQQLGQSYRKTSCVLYEDNLPNVDRVLRPSYREGTPERRRWQQEIERLRRPSPLRLAGRRLRNLFNMLRDAFAQSLQVLFGAWKRTTRFANLAMDEGKVGEMGKTLVSAVPNAYEPILEKYLGDLVVIETLAEPKVVEQKGVLQEYSSKYILARDVEFLPEIPPLLSSMHAFGDRYDVVFPRPANVVRHRAEEITTPTSAARAEKTTAAANETAFNRCD